MDYEFGSARSYLTNSSPPWLSTDWIARHASELAGQSDFNAKPQDVRRWMAKKADLADGMQIGLRVCGPSSVVRTFDDYLQQHGEWHLDTERRSWRGSQLAHIGLLRELCSLPFN